MLREVKNAAVGGLTVKYPTGHRDKLDVAIRRAALTGVGQTCAEIGVMNAKEMGCYLMEITAHSGARPEHAKWQGQLVTLTGQDAGKIIDGMEVFTLSEIGYGTGAGFRGWNCRHDWYPYFPGISTPNYSKEELEKLNEKSIEWNGEKYTEYEITQMQRAGERKVRALKRECIANDTAMKNASDAEAKSMFQSEYQKSAVKLKTAEQQLKEFCNATGQDRDKFREQVLGFSRSEAQKAVWASKKAEKGLTLDGRNAIIEEAVQKGKISLKLNPEKQNPHIFGTKEYDPTKNKSYFTVPIEELQEIIDQKHGTGNLRVKSNGQIKETITLNDYIGICIDVDGTDLGKTNRITVHYSKKRTHTVPSRGENNES